MHTRFPFLPLLLAFSLLPFAISAPLTILAIDPLEQPVEGVTLTAHLSSCESARLGHTDTRGLWQGALPAGWDDEFAVTGTHPEWPLLISPPLPVDATLAVVEALPVGGVIVRGSTRINLRVSARVLDRPDLPPIRISGVARENIEDRAVLLPRLPRCRLKFRDHSRPSDRGFSSFGREELDFLEGPASAEVRIELETPRIWLDGQVIDLSGAPIPAATVSWIYSTCADELPSAVTDADGHFLLEGQPRWIRHGVRAHAVGHSMATAEVRSAEDPVMIQLGRGITMRGSVANPPSERGLYVHCFLFVPDPDHWFVGWRMCGSGGAYPWHDWRFSLSGWDLPEECFPGPAFALFVSEDGEIAVIDVPLSEDLCQVRDLGPITLESGFSLCGRVVDPEGRPVPEAQVSWENGGFGLRNGINPIRWEVETGGAGSFRLFPLPEGHWRIGIIGPRHLQQSFEVDLRGELERDFVVTPVPGANLHVTVVDEDGAPVEGAHLELFDERLPHTSNIMVNLRARALTDAAGTAVFCGLPPGPHAVFALMRAEREHHLGRLALEIGEEDRRVQIAIRPSSHIPATSENR